MVSRTTLRRKFLSILIAMSLLLTLALPSVALGGENQWTSNGPNGGGIYSIALSPSYATDATVFAGTSGGVYKSTSGGASWNAVNKGFPNTTVNSIALSPSYTTDATLFAGTESGIYKSTDGGSGWSTVNNGLPSATVKSIALSQDYATDATVFAGIYKGGVYKSTDGGTSWTAVNSGLANNKVYSIALSPNYPTDGTLFAGTYYGVYKSTDRGASWTRVGLVNDTVSAIAFSPNYATDATIFAGASGGVCKSTDGGASWVVMNSSLTGASSIAVSPNYSGDATLFASTFNGLYRSANGGVNWTSGGFISMYGSSAIALSPNYATDATLFSGTYDSGIYKSTNKAASWTQINSGIINSYVNSIALSPNYATDKTLFAGTWDGIHKSTDGGASWARVGLANDSVSAVALSPGYATDATLFARVFGAGVYKSTNGGASWVWASSGLTNSNVNAIALSPDYTIDKTLFAGTSGGIYKSTDGGANWTLVNSGLSGNSISSIALAPNYATDKTLFVGTNGGVYKSTDAGANWTAVNSGLPSSYVSTIALSPNYPNDGTLLAGKNEGIYKSIDGGSNWIAVGGSTVTNVRTFSFSPNYQTDATVFAGTSGSGVLKSIDGGASWTQVNSGLTNLFVPSIALSSNYPTDATLFAGTTGGGVYSYTFVTPPTTTPSTDPTAPDGTNGWFVSPTTITLASTEPGTTYYQWDTDAGQWATYEGQISAPEGAHTLYYYSVDAASCSEAVESMPIKVDLASSQSTVTSPSDGAYLNGAPITVTGTSSDTGSGVARVEVSIDGGAWIPATGTDSWSYSWTPPSNDGNHSIRSRAVDSAGNIEAPSPGVNVVVDRTPTTTSLASLPSTPDGTNSWFVSPTTITLASAELGSTYYQWDSDSGEWATYEGPISVLEGAHTLYYYSEDVAGNKEAIQSRSVKLDLTAPILTAPHDLTLEATSPDGAEASFAATATDNLGSPTVTYSKNPGSILPLGDTTVTVSARDDAGNTTTKSFKVRVQDATAPSVTAPSDITAEATGPGGARIDFAATATDAVGPVSVAYSQNPGTIFALGRTVVAVTATDGAGNTSTASFTVNVKDTIAPSAPSNPSVTRSGSGLSLSWSASTDAVGVTRYAVERSTDQSNWMEIGSTSSTSYSDTNPPTNVRCYYRMKAYDAAGNASGYSAVGNGLVDTQAPTAPTAIKATVNSTLLLFTQSISLTWSGAWDNVGVSSYLVQKSSDGKTWSNLATISASAASYNDTNITSLTTYYYRVLAVDAAGNSSTSPSPIASILTLFVLK